MTDLLSSLASKLEEEVEERCRMIRDAAEEIIAEFRAMASRIAAGEAVTPQATHVAQSVFSEPAVTQSLPMASEEDEELRHAVMQAYQVTDTSANRANMDPRR